MHVGQLGVSFNSEKSVLMQRKNVFYLHWLCFCTTCILFFIHLTITRFASLVHHNLFWCNNTARILLLQYKDPKRCIYHHSTAMAVVGYEFFPHIAGGERVYAFFFISFIFFSVTHLLPQSLSPVVFFYDYYYYYYDSFLLSLLISVSLSMGDNTTVLSPIERETEITVLSPIRKGTEITVCLP